MMGNMLNRRLEKWLKEAIAEEMLGRDDLLPPWRKYPDIPRYSIGWRMGKGESYIMIWMEWSNHFDREQLLAYFTKYSPIPVDWLDWVSFSFGFDDDIFSQDGDFLGIYWLEEHHLASYAEFKTWLDKIMSEDLSD